MCDSFTFQNSTTVLFGGPTDSCSDVNSDVQIFSEAFGGNVSKSSSYDHLAKSFKPKQPSPLSHQSSYRSQFTDDSSARNSDGKKTPQSYESSLVTKDEELLDDFDYDEIDDTPTTHTRTQYNNLVHSGKEHRLSKSTVMNCLCFDHTFNKLLLVLYINNHNHNSFHSSLCVLC